MRFEKHLNDLNLFLNQFSNQVEVLFISEARLTDRNMKFCDLSRYNLYYCKSDSNAGGSAVYVSDGIKSRQLSQLKIKAEQFEYVWVKLILNYKDQYLWDQSTDTHMTLTKKLSSAKTPSCISLNLLRRTNNI